MHRLTNRTGALLCAINVLLGVTGCVDTRNQPLASWNNGPSKQAILKFVAAVTDENGKDYVNPAERIVAFDNDGTLWVEYPMYTQVLFAFDRVKQLAPARPEWKTKQPFKALLEGDMKTVGESGMKGLIEIVVATHSGMTGGFSMYISDGRLHYAYNYLDGVHYHLTSKAMPKGKTHLKFKFIKTREFGGTGELHANGKKVDETDMPKMHIST